jgi:DNA damage-binding protein 1
MKTTDIIPRSILIENLESIEYLFVSLGDGSVISFVINRIKQSDKKVTYELCERRKVVLGTQPTILKRFQTEKPILSNNIFACSDRPSVISTTNQKLVYSSVNLKQVEYMCQLNARDYPNRFLINFLRKIFKKRNSVPLETAINRFNVNNTGTL